jgi:hypothetical protein
MTKEYPDPGPCPENATPQEIEAWRRATELFCTEGFRKGAAKSPANPKIDATDARLKALQRDHIKFLERHNPMTDALWLALLSDDSDVLYDDEMDRRFRQALVTGTRVVDGSHKPAIVSIARRLVAQALKGDASAFQQIADRIEGKAGLRRDDIDPSDPQRARETRAIVDQTVRALTDARIRDKQVDAIDVEAKLVKVEK